MRINNNTRSRISLVSHCALGVSVLLVASLFASTASFAQTKLYQSTATFRITSQKPFSIRLDSTSPSVIPDPSSVVFTRHEILFASELMIAHSMDASGLNNLKSFDQLARKNIARHVKENMSLQPYASDPTVINIQLLTSEASDAKVVIANLVSDYRKHVNLSYRHEIDNRFGQLQKLKDELNEEYKRTRNKVREIVKQKEEHALQGPELDRCLVKLTATQSKIEAKKNWQNLVAEAIKKNNSMESSTLVWMLGQRGEIAPGTKAGGVPDTLTSYQKLCETELKWLQQQMLNESAKLKLLVSEKSVLRQLERELAEAEKKLSGIEVSFRIVQNQILEIVSVRSSVKDVFRVEYLREPTDGKPIQDE